MQQIDVTLPDGTVLSVQINIQHNDNLAQLLQNLGENRRMFFVRLPGTSGDSSGC